MKKFSCFLLSIMLSISAFTFCGFADEIYGYTDNADNASSEDIIKAMNDAIPKDSGLAVSLQFPELGEVYISSEEDTDDISDMEEASHEVYAGMRQPTQEEIEMMNKMESGDIEEIVTPDIVAPDGAAPSLYYIYLKDLYQLRTE